MTRQIVLDTETTGFNFSNGDRLVEIGCLELIDRQITNNHFHVYINPERDMPEEAFKVHGLSEAFLQDKPLFHEIAEAFLTYLDGDELIIHNARFDVPFLNFELKRIGFPLLNETNVIDTLTMARAMYPGQRNTLDALCRRFEVDNSNRELHGALIDSELLAQVYLKMTGGQETLTLSPYHINTSPSLIDEETSKRRESTSSSKHSILDERKISTRVIYANKEELEAHEAFLASFNQPT